MDSSVMEPQTLGRSGLRVTALGLGLAALGRPGYINLGHGEDTPEDGSVEGFERRTHEVIDAAYGAGIRYFDVARSYGRSEAFLASWLDARSIDPGSVTVGSKWGYTYTAEWRVDVAVHEVKEHSLSNLETQLAESRDWLGRHLALYQIHSATPESGILEDEAILRRLAELSEEGIAIGITTSGPAQPITIERAIEIEVDGSPVFASVQATWNLLEVSSGEALAAAHRAGMGVIVKEAVANGRLTERNPQVDQDPGLARLQSEARRIGVSIDALAIAAAVHQPWSDVVLSGAANVAQLESNLGALRVPTEELSIPEELSEEPEEYWRVRGSLPWT